MTAAQSSSASGCVGVWRSQAELGFNCRQHTRRSASDFHWEWHQSPPSPFAEQQLNGSTVWLSSTVPVANRSKSMVVDINKHFTGSSSAANLTLSQQSQSHDGQMKAFLDSTQPQSLTLSFPHALFPAYVKGDIRLWACGALSSACQHLITCGLDCAAVSPPASIQRRRDSRQR